jgi:diguanylate cyclase (GGDEF)-like protein/PAS domain S-box-containing protein
MHPAMAKSARPHSPKPARDAAAPVDAESRALLFASVMANANDAVLVTEAEPFDHVDGGPKIIYVNEMFTRMTGYSSAEAVGQTPRMLQSPRTDRRELDRLRRALPRWESVQVELLNVRKDGSEFWVQFTIVPVTDADGWYTHWVSIQRDVTERRRGDDELAAMVRDSSDVVAVIEPDGTITAVSPAAERELGAAGGSLVGTDVARLLSAASRPAAAAMLAAAQSPGGAEARRELELRTPGGTRTYEAAARLVSRDGSERVVVSAADVTDRKAARAALLVARRRFAAAFAEAPIGMAMLDRDGALVEVNAQLCRLLGRDAHRMLELTLDQLVHPEDRAAWDDERRRIFDGSRGVSRRETRLVHADGRVVGVMLSSSVVHRDDAIAELVVHVEDITERKGLEERLTHQALHDDLTGLPNRALFLDRLRTALRGTSSVAVLFLDIDRFKAVNDSYGHQAGDLVLRTVASRLQKILRPGDTASRFAGDEFTIVCDGDSGSATTIADRIAAAIEAPVALPPFGEVRLRASIGIASTVTSGSDADALLRDADIAMYAAKAGVDARHVTFDDQLRSRNLTRMDEEQALRRAIEGEELLLHYQPICRLGSAAGPLQFEALVRWEHPRRGLLLPGAFIPGAEQSGLIVELDRWVLRRACADLAGLGVPAAKVWVNLSLRSLARPGLAAEVRAALRASAIPATALGLEITERAVASGGGGLYHAVEELRALGVALAADDFGTGFSSLSALIERPVDVLKVDQSFISGLPAPTGAAVVRAIVAMAAALGLETVAEGVEREEQLDAVRALGCDSAQGFLLARPMPVAALAAYYGATAAAA